MNRYIYHSGVKGMKWGVRRTQKFIDRRAKLSKDIIIDNELRRQTMNSAFARNETPDEKRAMDRIHKDAVNNVSKNLKRYAKTESFLRMHKDIPLTELDTKFPFIKTMDYPGNPYLAGTKPNAGYKVVAKMSNKKQPEHTAEDHAKLEKDIDDFIKKLNQTKVSSVQKKYFDQEYHDLIKLEEAEARSEGQMKDADALKKEASDYEKNR